MLFTTNCIVPPKNEEVRNRIFTTGSAGLAGSLHISADANGKKDFSKIIALARTLQAPEEIETGSIVGGFAHSQVLALADKVVDAVKSGAIKKFFVMAGCDGRMRSRDYYTEFAEKLPKDTVILTAGCAKYRYNKLNLGDIGGIPRVLDAGQCNDSYSLAVIALKLKEVFGLDDINSSYAFNIAWYEQKAVHRAPGPALARGKGHPSGPYSRHSSRPMCAWCLWRNSASPASGRLTRISNYSYRKEYNIDKYIVYKAV